jgi:hypothetical protein
MKQVGMKVSLYELKKMSVRPVWDEAVDIADKSEIFIAIC